MPEGQFIILTSDMLPELAKVLAPLIRDSLANVEHDPYLTPKQISVQLPIMSEYMIRTQVRGGKYGKKYGAKGKLMAKVSEVKKFNKI